MPKKIRKKVPRKKQNAQRPGGAPLGDTQTWNLNVSALRKVLPALALALESPSSADDQVADGVLFEPVRTDVESITVVTGSDTLTDFLVRNQGADISKIRLLILLEDSLASLRKFLRFFDISRSLLSGSMLIVLKGAGEWNLAVELRNRCIAQPHLLALCRAVQLLGSQVRMQRSMPFFQKYLEEVRSGLYEGRIYYGNDPHDSLIGIENMFDNLDIIVENPGVNCFKGAFAGVPAFIVATGPSLDEALPHLKDAAHRGLVFACDASVRPLVEAGVDFQLVTSVERKPLISKFFATFDASRTFLCAPPLQNRHTFESFSGKKIITYRNVKHFDWIGIERGMLDIKSSVANMAYVIADYMGCDPIILVGQDLSYGDSGSTHAANFAMEDAIAIEKSRQKFAVPSNRGTPVLTHQIWYSCVKSYEVDIARSRATTINTTLRGVRIGGTTVKPLEEVIAGLTLHDHDFRNVMEAHVLEHRLLPSEAVYQQLSQRIMQGISECQRVLEACEQASGEIAPFIQGEVNALLQQQIDDIPPARVDEVYDTLLKRKQGIVESGGATYECLIMHVFQSYVLDELIREKELAFKYQAPHMAKINIIARFPQWIDECRKHTISVEKVLRRAGAQLNGMREKIQ
ncbi:DUF115 domain-containing protein [Desulfurispirillum indicum]|uniref:6-hydroxymethylpterin diphosphokinase MptE-like domain-containing protein n=1 Tax=Desulfurispirillum indicum (strain ATCC BAA-1389 / DSM 22839 / S5) TaxID=653733 RepID=E6W2L1_DESIS|nr:6-hydroxymethylpterin diphosphokinase MptE-like protein [Desulfurispirillum indicum]ADU65595.1 protein of unknown function DUF115 [Desulfurispirillum indicum S5]UCZ57573.1 DUF115 domain-containing protein [Desulfurispirillum indicum]